MTEKAYTTGADFPPLAEGTLRLYSMRLCPFAQRARLLLNLKGIPYETVNISLEDKPEWLLDRNPNGKVPVLEQDGRILYESLIVSEYVDTVYPADGPVIPANPYRKARDAMLIDFYGNKYIPNYYKMVFSEGKDKEAAQVIITALQKLENELKERKSVFFGGEKAAFIDYMVWPWLERLPVLTHFNGDVNLTSFPLTEKWREAMLTLPAVQLALLDTKTHLEFYRQWRAKNPKAFDVGLPE